MGAVAVPRERAPRDNECDTHPQEPKNLDKTTRNKLS
jgi:hypothetical protein